MDAKLKHETLFSDAQIRHNQRQLQHSDLMSLQKRRKLAKKQAKINKRIELYVCCFAYYLFSAKHLSASKSTFDRQQEESLDNSFSISKMFTNKFYFLI